MYITKQDSLIETRDPYALKMKEVWNNMANSHNFIYNEKEIDALIEYLR